jgi:hypothetical protein
MPFGRFVGVLFCRHLSHHQFVVDGDCLDFAGHHNNFILTQLRHILNLAQILAMRNVQTDVNDSASRGWLFGSVRNSDDLGATIVTATPAEGCGGSSSTSSSTAALTTEDDNDSHDHDASLNNNNPNPAKDECVPSSDPVTFDGSGAFSTPGGEFNGPKMITFDGDQTLYSDGSNFDSNPALASYLCQLLKHGVIVAVVTAAGYEYNVEKYEFRLSGLLNYFKAKNLTAEECERFLLFGGECNYLLHVSMRTPVTCRVLTIFHQQYVS